MSGSWPFSLVTKKIHQSIYHLHPSLLKVVVNCQPEHFRGWCLWKFVFNLRSLRFIFRVCPMVVEKNSNGWVWQVVTVMSLSSDVKHIESSESLQTWNTPHLQFRCECKYGYLSNDVTLNWQQCSTLPQHQHLSNDFPISKSTQYYVFSTWLIFVAPMSAIWAVPLPHLLPFEDVKTQWINFHSDWNGTVKSPLESLCVFHL